MENQIEEFDDLFHLFQDASLSNATFGCTLLAYQNDAVVDHLSLFRLQVPAGQIRVDSGASTISLLHLLAALRQYSNTINVGNSLGSLDISPHRNGVLSNLLQGVYPPYTLVTLSTFRIPSFSSLSQLKCDPMSGFRGIDAQDNIISIGSSLRSNSIVTYFESIWAPHGIDLDTHFILAYTLEAVGPPLPVMSITPLHQPSPLPSPEHLPFITAPSSQLQAVQHDHASTDRISQPPFHPGPPVDQQPLPEIANLHHPQLCIIPAHVESYNDVVTLLRPIDPTTYDRMFKLAIYTRNATLFSSAQSFLSMSSVVEKLGTVLRRPVLASEVVPHFNWSPVTYRNKHQHFTWAYNVARSSKWNALDKDTGSKRHKAWDAMVFLFKEGGALDQGTPPKKHSHLQIEREAFSLTSAALTNLQKYVNQNAYALEDL